MRAAVFARDHGICTLCKADTEVLQAEYRKMIPRGMHSVKDGESPAEKFRIQHGVPIGRASGDWWDADHITPVIEGGGECGIENYRTLCIPCHVKATRELRARMKERRREEKAVVKDAARGLFAGL
jgi:5-methylcytosine-specific restriction endonuclease McrA